MRDTIRRRFFDSAQVKTEFAEKNEKMIVEVVEVIHRALSAGKKVFFFGNGGSASDAQHLAAELVGRLRKERDPIAAIALTTDTSVITALGNDFGFETIFSRQILAIGERGDVAVAISTSGNSKNILEGIKAARAKEMITVGFLGKDGGQARTMVDYPLVVESDNAQIVQEVHITLGHFICEELERRIVG